MSASPPADPDASVFSPPQDPSKSFPPGVDLTAETHPSAPLSREEVEEVAKRPAVFTVGAGKRESTTSVIVQECCPSGHSQCSDHAKSSTNSSSRRHPRHRSATESDATAATAIAFAEAIQHGEEEEEPIVTAEDESWGSWGYRKAYNGLLMFGVSMYHAMQAAWRHEVVDPKVLEFTDAQYIPPPPTRAELEERRALHQHQRSSERQPLVRGGSAKKLNPLVHSA